MRRARKGIIGVRGGVREARKGVEENEERDYMSKRRGEGSEEGC